MPKPPAAPKRRRLGAQEREQQIIEAAIGFFAEVGINGNTRELARRIGITQPLLYRYFPSKEHLLERIYEELYERRWKPEWEALVEDRSLPVLERFRRFEKDYQRTILTYDWLRIFVSSGLHGYRFPPRYLARVKERIFTPVLRDLRLEMGLPAPVALPRRWGIETTSGADIFQLLADVTACNSYGFEMKSHMRLWRFKNGTFWVPMCFSSRWQSNDAHCRAGGDATCLLERLS